MKNLIKKAIEKVRPKNIATGILYVQDLLKELEAIQSNLSRFLGKNL